MFELVTSNLHLIAAFVLGSLLPTIIRHFNTLFFTLPDNFVHFVNTTIVPRFGDNGGKIILVVTQVAVAIIQQVGKMIALFVRTVFPLVLQFVEIAIPIVINITQFVKPYLLEVIPFLQGFLDFLGWVYQEIVLFFSWTKEAMTSEFGKFMFHVFLLYFSVHCLFYFGKRLVKKLV